MPLYIHPQADSTSFVVVSQSLRLNKLSFSSGVVLLLLRLLYPDEKWWRQKYDMIYDAKILLETTKFKNEKNINTWQRAKILYDQFIFS